MASQGDTQFSMTAEQWERVFRQARLGAYKPPPSERTAFDDGSGNLGELSRAELLSMLESITRQHHFLEEIEANAVEVLRAMHTPWPMIAEALNLSRSTVVRKHG